MINSRNEIVELLKEYMITNHEYTKNFMFESEQWSGKRQAIYSNGTVLGKFREKDSTTIKILKEGVNDKALYNEIKLNLEHNIEVIKKLNSTDQTKLEIYINQKKICQLILLMSGLAKTVDG